MTAIAGHTIKPPSYEEPPAKRARMNYSPSIQGRHRETGLMRRNGDEDITTFVGSSSGIFFVRAVSSTLASEATPSDSHAHTPQTDIVPGEDDRLTTASADTKPIKNGLWTQQERSPATSVTFDELRTFAEEYFDHWHPTFPFLFAPAILECFEKVSRQPLSKIIQILDSYELTIIRAIMSISAADRRQCGRRGKNRPVPRYLLFHSYTEAMDFVQGCMSIPASIKSLQAVLAVQLFLVSMLRHNGASRLGGLAVRLAFQLGLHRCPVRYASFSPEEAQMRKRIFWTTYCLDRILCQALGLPLGIRDDDIDVCGFDHEKHQDPSLPQAPLDPRLASVHFLTKHAQIKGMIVELCNKNVDQRPLNADMTHAIEEAAGRWKNEMDAFMELNPNDITFHKGRRATLEVLKYECHIALNRPLLALPKHMADYHVALQTCITAARATINDLHAKLLAHQANINSSDETSVLMPLFWPTFTWMVWMSSFIVLYAATNGEIPKKVATRLVEKSIEVLNHLSTRGTLWPDACAAAIRELSAKLETTSSTDLRKAMNMHMQFDTHQTSNGNIVVGTHNDAAGQLFQTHNTTRHDTAGQSSNGQPLPSRGMTESTCTEPVPIAATPSISGFEHDPSLLVPWPIDSANDVTLFDGFDIPFHLGDDQYGGVLNGWYNTSEYQ